MNKHLFSSSIDKSAVSAAALAGVALVALLLGSGLAVAKPVTNASCHKKYESCLGRCLARYSAWVGKAQYVELVTNCNKRTCQKQYDNCLKSVGVGSTGGKVETPPDPLTPKGGNPRTPPTGGTKGDPKKPPRTGEHTPPTGGTKGEPKMPPKVNDTRPPLGGGVFGRPQTTGAGSGGPIILRSNGGSGMGAGNGAPIMRSAGGRR